MNIVLGVFRVGNPILLPFFIFSATVFPWSIRDLLTAAEWILKLLQIMTVLLPSSPFFLSSLLFCYKLHHTQIPFIVSHFLFLVILL